MTGPAPETRRTGTPSLDGTVEEIVSHLQKIATEHRGLDGVVDTVALAMIHSIMDSDCQFPAPAGGLAKPATPAWRCQRIRAVLDAVEQINETGRR
ncbi:MAG: hypothetical protein V7603_5154 [Micromonosporaceae bacterium]